MADEFTLKILSLHWLSEPDDGYDLCAHGELLVMNDYLMRQVAIGP